MTPEQIDRLRELLPGALGHVNSLMDAGWKQLEHAWQVLNALPDLLAALAAKDAEIARLREGMVFGCMTREEQNVINAAEAIAERPEGM